MVAPAMPPPVGFARESDWLLPLQADASKTAIKEKEGGIRTSMAENQLLEPAR
jgi:hypothetical protein